MYEYATEFIIIEYNLSYSKKCKKGIETTENFMISRIWYNPLQIQRKSAQFPIFLRRYKKLSPTFKMLYNHSVLISIDLLDI